MAVVPIVEATNNRSSKGMTDDTEPSEGTVSMYAALRMEDSIGVAERLDGSSLLTAA